MNKTGHSIGCILVSTASIYYLHTNILNDIIMTSGIVLGSFLPDLDADYSFIEYKLKGINPMKVIQKILPNNPVTDHRGALLHSILTIIPCIIFMKYDFVKGLGLGILGHHILDMMTPAGLRYFFPFKFKIRLFR